MYLKQNFCNYLLSTQSFTHLKLSCILQYGEKNVYIESPKIEKYLKKYYFYKILIDYCYIVIICIISTY